MIGHVIFFEARDGTDIFPKKEQLEEAEPCRLVVSAITSRFGGCRGPPYTYDIEE